MEVTDNCTFEKVVAIPDFCTDTGADSISELYFGNLGNPLVLLSATNGETPADTLRRTLNTRLSASGDSKIYVKPIHQGIMPEGQSNEKLRPDTGAKIITESDMGYEWTDYEMAIALYDWYRQMSGADELNSVPVTCLCWAIAGNNLIGGLKGYRGTLMAKLSISEDANVAMQIKSKFNFKVKGGAMPRILKIS
jgi:hypothetical protein